MRDPERPGAPDGRAAAVGFSDYFGEVMPPVTQKAWVESGSGLRVLNQLVARPTTSPDSLGPKLTFSEDFTFNRSPSKRHVSVCT